MKPIWGQKRIRKKYDTNKMTLRHRKFPAYIITLHIVLETFAGVSFTNKLSYISLLGGNT